MSHVSEFGTELQWDSMLKSRIAESYVQREQVRVADARNTNQNSATILITWAREQEKDRERKSV
jgi:hypothetical protein